MTDPLELHGENHRVRFSDTDMKTHEITVKLQAMTVQPLVTQLVVDVIPKLMLVGRPELARKNGLKPSPKSYLRFSNENQTDALKLVVLALTDYLVVSSNGHMTSTESLALEVESLAKQIKTEVAHITFGALEKISAAREGVLR